jgi:hypothetical protein
MMRTGTMEIAKKVRFGTYSNWLTPSPNLSREGRGTVEKEFGTEKRKISELTIWQPRPSRFFSPNLEGSRISAALQNDNYTSLRQNNSIWLEATIAGKAENGGKQ